MRTIMEHTSTGHSGANVESLTKRSLAELGWTWPDLGIKEDDLVALASAVIEAGRRARRDLPVSPESQFIQDAIDKRFRSPGGSKGNSGDDGSPDLFGPFSFERHCLEQAILILTQIDEVDRREAFAREMTVVAGPEFGVYGIMFHAPSGQDGDLSKASYQTRLRCNDLETLQTATISFVSAIHPADKATGVRRFTSQNAAIGRRLGKHKPFVSDVRRLEIRSVTNERLFQGRVIPVTGRFSLLRRVLAGRSARVLTAVSGLLILVSAVLFALAPSAGWWEWSEQLLGRLATGAFGALLVDGAIDYTALHKSLVAGRGPVTHGAIIDWERPQRNTSRG